MHYTRRRGLPLLPVSGGFTCIRESPTNHEKHVANDLDHLTNRALSLRG